MITEGRACFNGVHTRRLSVSGRRAKAPGNNEMYCAEGRNDSYCNTTIRDKVVVITGGARGTGFATATALHNLGARVALGDVDEAKLKQSATTLGVDIYGTLDVTDPDSFSSFLDDVERQLGPLTF